MAAPSHTLIVGPAWVGDMVMAQSLYKLLKNREPNSTIDVLAPAWSLPLLARMPEVRKGIEVPFTHGEFGLFKRSQLGRQLRKQQYEQAIVLPRSFKSALIPFFAKAKKRIGYRGEMRYGLINDIRTLDKSVLTMTVQRYLALGMDPSEPLPPEVIPEPKLSVDKSNLERLVRELQLEAEGVVALLPGAAYGPAKQWPIAYWAELTKQLQQASRPVWILGGEKDHQVAEQIIAQAGVTEGVHNLCGNTTLVDAVDLLSICAVAVSNDSGLMHVAAAVEIPLVGIYGSSTPDYTPPLTAKAQVLYLGLECSPCFKRTCPLGHLDCLKGIKVEEVMDRVKKQLSIEVAQ